jgi:ATP-dependent helicase HepA
MALARQGAFVCSSANSLGTGKLHQAGSKGVVVEYFLGPGCEPRRETVPAASVKVVNLDCETRVYQRLPDGVSWRAGRALAPHQDDYLVRFPNNSRGELVPAVELFTRCELPLPDPATFLAARITETPIWQQLRTRFVQAIAEQRRACAGLTALLSAGIDLEAHQVEVIRRILQDPVQRYLLADEVGLGKTIEAGVIIRQYVLDHPTDHGVLVLVPPHLVKQWEGELEHRFRLGPLLGESVHVLPHDTPAPDHFGPSGLVVIDEAHQVTRWAASPSSKVRKQFGTIRELVTAPGTRLLLLSATPTLHSDENGFQAMLHLLDPVVYPLGDLEGFRLRLAQHEQVAKLYHLFRPDEEGTYLEGVLDQFVEGFPSDARLGELASGLRPLLGFGADVDDPRREELIRATRAHVSEAYRLHRRLLRNRRADDRVDGLLPGRVGLVRWEYDDPAAAHLAGILDEWRADAAAVGDSALAPDYGRLLGLFAEALTSGPETVAALVTLRQGETPDDPPPLTAGVRQLLTATPEFDGEDAHLARLRDAAEAASPDPRLAALIAGLENQFAAKSRVTRAVVFASYPADADAVYDALVARWPGAVVRHGRPGWHHFRTTDSFRALVCDASAEEGLNLHGRGTILVHYDLPWSPNRVEQRVGRLDRFGVATPVTSAVLLARGDSLAAACADYLDRGYGVFARSVAALQYMTESELASLYPLALLDGPAAFAAAADRLGGKDGADGEVKKALADIQVLDELDAVEVPPGHEHFAGMLRDTDSLRKTEWHEATHEWADRGLQFARRAEGGRESGVWRYQFRRPLAEGPSTLMPVGRLVRHFRHIIDPDDDRCTTVEPITYPISFDRGRAQRLRVSLGRIGDPFINALAEYITWDDRGAVSAMWRYRPKAKFARPAEVAFRFEFVVECPAVEAAGLVGGQESLAAVRRQADWVFPPFAISVWLDENLEPIPHNSSKSAILSEQYVKRTLPDGGRDFNLNSDRWAAIASYFPRSAWVHLVEQAREAAERSVRESPQWESEIETRRGAARRADADRTAQAASRLAFLTGTQRENEAARADTERAVAAALSRGIENPTVRLDAAGAVFLADWNPFTDADE